MCVRGYHSDQGTQYTSIQFGKRCKQLGVRPSTGSVGDAYDNAMAESFFATLETELLWRSTFRSHAEARMAIFEFIEGFYNLRRRHSALGDIPRSSTKGGMDKIRPRTWKLTTSLLLQVPKLQAFRCPPK